MPKIKGWSRDKKREGDTHRRYTNKIMTVTTRIREWTNTEYADNVKGKPSVTIDKQETIFKRENEVIDTQYQVYIRAFREEATMYQFNKMSAGSLATRLRMFDTRRKAMNYATRWIKKHPRGLV